MKRRTKKKTPPIQRSLVPIERKPDLKTITDILGDPELAIFFMKWLECNRNATKAYMELHPNVDYNSATVLGSRQLGKVSIPVVLEALGLGVSKYMDQLKEGLAAQTGAILTKYDKQGHVVATVDLRKPDHKVRRLYHEPLGKMLQLEKDTPAVAVQNNYSFQTIKEMVAADRKARGLNP